MCLRNKYREQKLFIKPLIPESLSLIPVAHVALYHKTPFDFLYFLLPFIKHQNIPSLLRSHILRQTCPAGLPTAGTRCSGPNPVLFFMLFSQICPNSACCFLSRIRGHPANGPAVGNTCSPQDHWAACCPWPGRDAMGHGVVGAAGKVRVGKWPLGHGALPAWCQACFLLCWGGRQETYCDSFKMGECNS